MTLDKRYATRPDGSRHIRALLLVPENDEESMAIDECFGSAVGEDGLIAVGKCEVRLADAWSTHYIALTPTPKDAKEK